MPVHGLSAQPEPEKPAYVGRSRTTYVDGVTMAKKEKRFTKAQIKAAKAKIKDVAASLSVPKVN